MLASGRWLGVRLDLLTSLLTATVALVAVLVSQDPGTYVIVLERVTFIRSVVSDKLY